ncbi:hypothetical protein K438DRAFT_1781434 [Mycena galopus ATCC 62051]|nr:hypothetical protein K438DRAFT_1781434 [Mycena galopus ATCC 62051]
MYTRVYQKWSNEVQMRRLKPLLWFLSILFPLLTVSQEECAEHMLYALFAGKRGLFLCDRYGNVVSKLIFERPVELGESSQNCVLNGVPMKGFGASDLTVR